MCVFVSVREQAVSVQIGFVGNKSWHLTLWGARAKTCSLPQTWHFRCFLCALKLLLQKSIPGGLVAFVGLGLLFPDCHALLVKDNLQIGTFQ